MTYILFIYVKRRVGYKRVISSLELTSLQFVALRFDFYFPIINTYMRTYTNVHLQAFRSRSYSVTIVMYIIYRRMKGLCLGFVVLCGTNIIFIFHKKLIHFLLDLLTASQQISFRPRFSISS